MRCRKQGDLQCTENWLYRWLMTVRNWIQMWWYRSRVSRCSAVHFSYWLYHAWIAFIVVCLIHYRKVTIEKDWSFFSQWSKHTWWNAHSDSCICPATMVGIRHKHAEQYTKLQATSDDSNYVSLELGMVQSRTHCCAQLSCSLCHLSSSFNIHNVPKFRLWSIVPAGLWLPESIWWFSVHHVPVWGWPHVVVESTGSIAGSPSEHIDMYTCVMF